LSVLQLFQPALLRPRTYPTRHCHCLFGPGDAGGAAGLAAGHVSWRDVSTPGDIDAKGAFNIANTDMSGSVFGTQFGCDYQYASSWMFGISGMIARSDVGDTNQDQFNALWTLRNRVDWLATIAGR
jgi:hypothetical protein